MSSYFESSSLVYLKHHLRYHPVQLFGPSTWMDLVAHLPGLASSSASTDTVPEAAGAPPILAKSQAIQTQLLLFDQVWAPCPISGWPQLTPVLMLAT